MIKQLLATVTLSLLTANSVQAFEVISAEDLNKGGNGTHAAIDATRDAEQQFLSKLSSEVGTENFESYAWNTPAGLAISFPGAGSASLEGSGKVLSTEHVEGVTNLNTITHELNTGRNASSGVNYWQTSAQTGSSSTFSINLTEQIAAFGFYAFDLGDFGGELNINLYQDGELVGVVANSDHNLYQVANSGENNGSVVYIGIIGDQKEDGTYQTFDQVQFVIVNENGTKRDDFGFDDLTIATAEQLVVTPEDPNPPTIAFHFAD